MKNLKIVFLDEYSVDGTELAPIKALGDYTGYDYTTDELIIERSREADVIISNKVPLMAATIAQLPNLKLICVAATGTNNVDSVAAEKAGIPVRNAVGYSTHAVAESTLCGVLALYKQIIYYDGFVKSGGYAASERLFNFGRPTYQLHGKKWGVIGLGNIGGRVAELAKAFGCDVCYYSSTPRKDVSYEYHGLEELLAVSDIVSIHIPLTDDTLNLIDYHQLSLMKPTAVIANMSRGGIINESGLARALDNNLIAGAVLDVYTKEPIAVDNPLNKVADKYKLLLTPHSSWATRESLVILVKKIADNIREFIKTEKKNKKTDQ